MAGPDKKQTEQANAKTPTPPQKPTPKATGKKARRPYPPQENKRTDILQAAMKVLAFYGYDGATLDRIAEEAGVSKTLVVKYFGGKEALARLCIEHFVTGMLEKFRRINRAPGITWRKQSDAVFEFYRLNRNEWRFLLQLLCTPSLESFGGSVVRECLHNAYVMLESHAAEILPGKYRQAAYSMTALYFNFVIGGSEENFLRAREELFAHYELDT